MDKELGQKILTNIASQQGVPLTSQEIAAQIEADPVQTEKALSDMQKLGYVYKVQTGYWYVTKPGMDIVQGVKNIQPKGTNVYNTIARQYAELTPQMRDAQVKKSRAYVAGLKKVMQSYFEQFKANHPEYSKFFKYMENSPANEEEFYKDVQAMFLKWDAGNHDLLKYPNEQGYIYPQQIVALEHFMDESIRRYYQYMEYDRNKFMFQDEYKNTLNAVKEQIQPIAADANTFIAKEPQGTVVSFNAIRAWLNDRVGGAVAKGVNKELFFEKILQQIPQYINAQKLVFLSTTPEATILTDIMDVLHKGKNPSQIFNRFKGTMKESSTFEEEHIDEMFREQDYTGRDFSGMNLSVMTLDHVNFTDANLTSADLSGSVVEHCNFTNANMKFSNFDVGSLEHCIVEGADFDGANIKKDIKWDKQVGTAKNVTVSNVTFDKKSLRDALESRPTTSYSIPLHAEQVGEATALAKALRGVVEKLHTFSGMVRPVLQAGSSLKLGWSMSYRFIPGEKVKVTDSGALYVALQKHWFNRAITDLLIWTVDSVNSDGVTISIPYNTLRNDTVFIPQADAEKYLIRLNPTESSLKLGWQNLTLNEGNTVKLTDAGIRYFKKYFKQWYPDYNTDHLDELLGTASSSMDGPEERDTAWVTFVSPANGPIDIQFNEKDVAKYLRKIKLPISSSKLAWKQPLFAAGSFVLFTDAGKDYLKRRFTSLTGITEEATPDLFSGDIEGTVDKAVPGESVTVSFSFPKHNFSGYFTPIPVIVTLTEAEAENYLIINPSKYSESSLKVGWQQNIPLYGPLRAYETVKLTPAGVQYIYHLKSWVRQYVTIPELAKENVIITAVDKDDVTLNFDHFILTVPKQGIDKYIVRTEPTEGSQVLSWDTTRDIEEGNHVMFTTEGRKWVMDNWKFYDRKELMGTFPVEYAGEGSIGVRLPTSVIPVPTRKQHEYLDRDSYSEQQKLAWNTDKGFQVHDNVKFTLRGCQEIGNKYNFDMYSLENIPVKVIATSRNVDTNQNTVTIQFAVNPKHKDWGQHKVTITAAEANDYLVKVPTAESSLKIAWNAEREFSPGDKVTFTPEGCHAIEHVYDIDSEYLDTVIADVIHGSESKNIVIKFASDRSPTGETVLAIAPQDAAKYLVQLPDISTSEGSLKLNYN